MFKPRAGQIDVIDYSGGKMGVSAVPGSGKTQTLSYLAANLVAGEFLEEDQEILIVTLVNSAVENFSNRVARFLRELKLIPGIGYRVRTLHGLAYDIVREFPDLVGLDNHFSIADERISDDILASSVAVWMQSHMSFFDQYAAENYPYQKNQRSWEVLLRAFGISFINQAKDLQLTTDDILNAIAEEKSEFPFLEMGCNIFSEYQNALTNRGAVDFEDLVRFAYKILMNNHDLLEQLRYRWPIILEDEAQDSSLVQEKLLRLICGENGNWVRMGDTNQAIFETFTTANPELLRNFIQEPDVIKCDLKFSGRSTKSIIDLANQLILWSNTSHPIEELRNTLTKPLIQPTLGDDPQQNPKDAPAQIYLYDKPLKPDEEIKIVANSLGNWLPSNPEKTVAVLVPRNLRGSELANVLNDQNIPFLEMLNSSKATRDAAKVLRDIIYFYTYPNSKRALMNAFNAILFARKFFEEFKSEIDRFLNQIKKNIEPQIILSDFDVFKEMINNSDIQPQVKNHLINSAELIYRWQRSVLLPIDQMIMTISIDIFPEAADLALAHKLAVVLKSAYRLHPDWELSHFCDELDLIVNNKFKLYGFSEDELAFEPENYKGKVIISTIHKAKGLEWDRVYLMSVNNYDFPSAQIEDQYISEKWFVKDKLNFVAEAIAQLKALANNDRLGLNQPVGKATLDARIDYAAERLRLFYVGITRAKEQLVVTWNTGRRSDCHEALPLEALRLWQEGKNNEA